MKPPLPILAEAGAEQRQVIKDTLDVMTVPVLMKRRPSTQSISSLSLLDEDPASSLADQTHIVPYSAEGPKDADECVASMESDLQALRELSLEFKAPLVQGG